MEILFATSAEKWTQDTYPNPPSHAHIPTLRGECVMSTGGGMRQYPTGTHIHTYWRSPELLQSCGPEYGVKRSGKVDTRELLQTKYGSMYRDRLLQMHVFQSTAAVGRTTDIELQVQTGGSGAGIQYLCTTHVVRQRLRASTWPNVCLLSVAAGCGRCARLRR